MKLQEIISDEHPEIKKLVNFIEKIKNDCQPFLEQSDEKPLMRGFAKSSKMPTPPHLGESIDIRMDRQPRDSKNNPFFNWTYNAVIKEEFGIDKVRMTSEYCTGDESVANYYGACTFMFPIGDFKFLWADKIRDSYDDITSLRKYYDNYQAITDEIVTTEFNLWRDSVVYPFMRKLIEKDDYNLDNLSFKKHGDPILAYIYSIIVDDYDRFKRTDLSRALTKGAEISIQGPGKYYVINCNKLQHLLNFESDFEQLYRELMKKFF